MRVTHIQLGSVAIHKEHVRIFLAWGGALLMLADMLVSIFGPFVCHIIHAHFEDTEAVFAVCGKSGAAMNGLVLIFEKFFRT